jgi:hypothetical protein
MMVALRPENRRAVFAVLVIACVVVAVGYGSMAVRRSRASRETGGGMFGDAAAARALIGKAPTVMFRNQLEGEGSAHLALVPLTPAASGARAILPLRCRRLYFAGGRGLCLAEDAGLGMAYEVGVLDAGFNVVRTLPLIGLPSRARVSPDGRYGATTVFVAGHSYSNGDFSTETTLFDLASGTKLANLEEFTVLRDGQPFKAVDFNFWGVTFAADGNRFYATLKTGGATYLVEGDIAARHMRMLHRNVECPSLSPDGTRIAYKKAVAGRRGVVFWRFNVLDLRTMTETPLAEQRSVDDQVEWLDDRSILYGVLSDVWVVPADGSGEPRRFLNRAASPVVIRTAVDSLLPADARTLTPPSADLGITLTAADAGAVVGQDFHYTLTVANRGPGTANLTDVDMRLSPAVTVQSYAPVNSTMPYGCSVQEGYFSCTIERLNPGESWAVDLIVQANAAGVLRHEVTVSGSQPDALTDNNRSSVELQVKAR